MRRARSRRVVLAVVASLGLAQPRFEAARLRSGSAPAPPSELTVGWQEALLEVAVDRTGTPVDVKALRGTVPFVDLVRDAVAGWSFRPASADGQPTEGTVLVAAIVRPRTLFNNPTLGEPSRHFAAASEAAPFPTTSVPPSYPPQARGDGVVLVEVLVGADGAIKQANVIGSPSGFDQPALAAARQWTFRPARRHGVPAPAFVWFPLACDRARRVPGELAERRLTLCMQPVRDWRLHLPRPCHAPRRLQCILRPRRGEHLLEIGPGIGTHSLPVACSLAPNGLLHVLDVQHQMLEEVMRRASTHAISNIVPTQGDATRLPYPAHTFDGVYLIGVLGEFADRDAALRGLHRVLEPRGRLVIGEIFVDPDFLSLGYLRTHTRQAGFMCRNTLGFPLAYLARFERA